MKLLFAIAALVLLSARIEAYDDPILQQFINNAVGSLPTPDPETYTFTLWTEYSECDKVCGGGRKYRTRTCLDSQGNSHDISKCTGDSLLGSIVVQALGYKRMKQVDDVHCNTRECAVTEWSEYDQCTVLCGGGIQYKYRKCLEHPDQKMCNFKSRSEPKDCNEHECFVPTMYGPWTECSRNCGWGQRSRTRFCVPNYPTTSPMYDYLKDLVEGVTVGMGLANSPSELFYLQQYQKQCRGMMEREKCIKKPCPTCDGDHVYHDCMPCHKSCKRSNTINHRDLVYSLLSPFFSSETSSTGCNEICEPGCACPQTSPYEGMNTKCYKAQEMCPGNILGGGFVNIFSTVLGGTTYTDSETTETDTYQPSNNYGGSSGRTFSGSPINTEKTTTTTTEAPTTTTEKPLVACPYQTAIAEQFSCLCDGGWRRMSCFGDDPSKCNWECIPKQKLICPAIKRAPVTRSGDVGECDDVYECENDEGCGNTQFKCCPSHCGIKACLPKLYKYDNEP